MNQEGEVLPVISESSEPEVRQDHLDELYKRLITSDALQRVFLGGRVDRLTLRSRKKQVAKAFFGESVYDQKEAKKNLEAIVRRQLKDLELAPLNMKDKRVLNIGANMPIFDEYLRIAKGCEVTSLDYFPSNQNIAFPGASGRYVYGDARMLPFKESSFGIILSHAAMPHILVQAREKGESDINLLEEEYDTSVIEDEVMMTLEESYRCLEPGGQIRFSTLHRNIELEEVDIFQPELSKSTREKVINKRTDIIKRVVQAFEQKYKCFVLYKDSINGLLLIKKPAIPVV